MSKRMKQRMAGEFRAGVGAAGACVVVGYKSLPGGTSTALRAHLRRARVDLTVLRNRVAVHALDGTALKGITPFIQGPTAVATGGDDAVALAKAVVEGVKGRPGFECRGGFVEGRVVTGDEVRRMATLPGRLELLASIAATVAQPMANVAYGVDAILTGMVRAVDALREKKEKEAAAPGAGS